MITKEEFLAYVAAKKSGTVSLHNLQLVSNVCGLSRDKVAEIQVNYDYLKKKYGEGEV